MKHELNLLLVRVSQKEGKKSGYFGGIENVQKAHIVIRNTRQ